jgi:hypothetical protein
MLTPRFKDVDVGEPLSAKEENRIRRFLNSLAQMLNAGGLDGIDVGGIMMLRKPTIPEQFFLAQVTLATLDTSTHTASFTATTVNGSPTLSSVSDTTKIQTGMVITGAGITASPPTYVLAFTGNSITLSANATAGASGVSMTAAMYLYDWKELTVEATATGAALTLTNGRTGSAATNPAYEVNNQHLDTTNPFYVFMRARGDVIKVSGGSVFDQLYDFENPGIASADFTTQQFVTNVCAQFIIGPLSPADGGTGSNLSGTGGPGQYLGQPTVGANLTPTSPANDPNVLAMIGVLGP